MSHRDRSGEVLPAHLASDLDRMISRTKTKLIAPVLTAGILRDQLETGVYEYSEREMRQAYEKEACRTVRKLLGHNLHVGGDYEDAYCSRTLPKYGIVASVGERRYRTATPYVEHAASAIAHIESRIPLLVAARLAQQPNSDRPRLG